jgi:signal transduction histidine kinase/CheY-like chemotaxis protein
MKDSQRLSIFTLRLRHERNVVHARQRARDIAALLGFDHQEQIRLATGTSELARNAFRYAENAAVEFSILDGDPQQLLVSVTDTGPGIADLDLILNGRYVSKTGLGKGIIGTKRLMDHFAITSSAKTGTRVEAGKILPANAPRMNAEHVRRITLELAKGNSADPFDEVERQNQELLKTLADLREKQDQLAELNQELEDTNRGVVALYAELDQHADDLRRVSDLKTSFLSNLSHEFRTPLNSITSLCQILMSRSDGDLSSEQEKQVNYIQKSASELMELVNDLLDLAKVEAGKIDVKPRHFEVQDLFGSLRGMLKPLLSGNSLDLIFDAAPDLTPLYSDEGKISQILRNLISNALKFTPRGYVRIAAHLELDDTIVFEVTDTGIGISEADQERIFEEFVQVESELQTRVKGTGLGLPLSRRLAGLLGGTITVQSEPGHGSTFTVRLPVHFGELKQNQNQISEPSNRSATGGSILFIEDNQETSFVHEASMRNSNYQLVFASNLPLARAIMRTSSPSAVALDRFIDGKDSLFYIQELKALGYSGPTVVISVVDDPQAAYDAGADAFLAKPVTPFSLSNTLRELIEGIAAHSVLLVDDDEVTRYLLAETLTRFDYRILEATNGREAIEMANTHVPTLMFLDIVMPDLTGFEVLREIRGNTKTSAIPVIVHTSKDLSVQELAYLKEMGAIYYPKQSFGNEASREQLNRVLAAAGLAP